MNEPQKTMFSQGIHAESLVRKEIIGCLRVLSNGRKWRYTKNGAVNLAASKPVESLDAVSNNLGLTVAAAVAVGSYTVVADNGGTAVIADQYAGGTLQIQAGTGFGREYVIESHTAESTGTGEITIQLAEPIGVALTTATSKVSLIYNDYTGVVLATAATKTSAGIPPIAVTANYYFWSQTGGNACAFVTNGVAVGTELSGGAGILAARTAMTDNSYGFVRQTAGVTAKFTPIRLEID